MHIFDNLTGAFFFRKASLNLIRKMIHYISSNLLVEFSHSDVGNKNFATLLTEVISSVLDSEVSLIPFLNIALLVCNVFLYVN